MFRPFIILCSVHLLVVACADYTNDPYDEWSARDQDVMESVYRYQHEQFSPFFNTSIVCLSWGDPLGGEGLDESSDPIDEFISRFFDLQPPVAKLSSCSLVNEDECFSIVDGESGLDGLIFDVVSINYVGNEKAEVEGGYIQTCVSAAGHLFTVDLLNGEWTVTADILLWTS